jgi:23S rRNA (adenine2503-C2)-methyltransferase
MVCGRVESLLGMLPVELAGWLAARGVERSDAIARQVLAHVVSRGGTLDLPRPVRASTRALLDTLSWSRPAIVERVEDPIDHGTVRYLFRADDGAAFEAVRIPIHKPGAFTVCLSSQVGCAMGCRFCATGKLGLARNLTAAEIVGSFLAVRDEAPGRITGAVFMGQGEPLHNYDEVIRAARILSDPCGGRIAKESITISTVGLVPALRRYTAEAQPYRLVVSLHAATDALRSDLVPVAGRVPLADLADAIRAHHARWGGRITVAWVLLGGVNMDPDQAAALRDLLGDVPLRVNLIDVNDAEGFRRATDDERGAFVDALQILEMPVVRRYSVGRASGAACGMLAAKAITPSTRSV